jgi:hypothetical protein
MKIRIQEVDMQRIAFIVSIAFILLSVCPTYAQFGQGVRPQFYSDFKPIVGGWSEYQLNQKGEPPARMKISIVDKEGDLYWYEMAVEDKQGEKMITKTLVSGNPNDQKNVKRIIVKTGNQPAMEIPVRMSGQSIKPQGSIRGKMIDKGSETIKVPAGTFTTHHFQSQEGETLVDTWVHKDISPYGLIKSQSKDFEMVLLSYGTGAKTQITETPKKFEMPKTQREFPETGPQNEEEDE